MKHKVKVFLPFVLSFSILSGCGNPSRQTETPTNPPSTNAEENQPLSTDEENEDNLETKKNTALALDEKIWETFLKSSEQSSALENCLTDFVQGNTDTDTMNDTISMIIKNLEDIQKDLNALQDNDNTNYISACNDSVMTLTEACKNLQKYITNDSDNLDGFSKNLENTANLLPVIIKERKLYLSSQGVSPELIDKLTESIESSLSNENENTTSEQPNMNDNNNSEKQNQETSVNSEEVYNYLYSLLYSDYNYPEPSQQELAEYFNLTVNQIESNHKAYLQVYFEHKHDEVCTQQTADKFGLTVDEVNHIWVSESAKQ